MKKRIFFISLCFIIIVILFTSIVIIINNNSRSEDAIGSQIVNINEVEQLIKTGNNDLAIEKLDSVSSYVKSIDTRYNYTPLIILSSITIIFILWVSHN